MRRTAITLAIANEVEEAVGETFERRSADHLADLGKELTKRGIVMTVDCDKRDVFFCADGHAVSGEEVGHPLAQLIAMSRLAGTPIGDEEIDALTSAFQELLDKGSVEPGRHPCER